MTLPLLWLAVSGYLLNHADTFDLHNRRVTAKWILNHYHQLPSGTPLGVEVGDRRISEWDQMIFLDERLLEIPGELVGAIPLNDQLLIVTRERVAVINGAGEMVDELDEASLPGLPIKNVASHDGSLFLEINKRWWRFQDNLIEYKRVSEAPPTIAKISPLPQDSADRLEVSIQNSGFMPFSRVLLDAHSGKLFGKFGVFMNDLAVFSIIVLTLLGLRLFPKRKSDGPPSKKRTIIDQPTLGDHSTSTKE